MIKEVPHQQLLEFLLRNINGGSLLTDEKTNYWRYLGELECEWKYSRCMFVIDEWMHICYALCTKSVEGMGLFNYFGLIFLRLCQVSHFFVYWYYNCFTLAWCLHISRKQFLQHWSYVMIFDKHHFTESNTSRTLLLNIWRFIYN